MKVERSKQSNIAAKPLAGAERLKGRTILTTTDFSHESQIGVGFAAALARKLGAPLHLVHVVERPSRISGMQDVPFALSDAEVAGLARSRVRNFADAIRSVRASSSVRFGKAFDQITKAAREIGAALIVISTHGHTGAKRVFLGSTAERVVRYAHCPVLTAPARGGSSASGFEPRKILVPIDFSTVSKDALSWAIALAGQFGGEIILVHVVEKFPIDYFSRPELIDEAITPLIKQSQTDLEHLAKKIAGSTGLNISPVVRSGVPFEEICRAAEVLKADLIALTTHGHTGLKRVWLGSTAERVVRHARCPVLAVRKRAR